MNRVLLIFSFILFSLPTLLAETADTSAVGQPIRLANRAFGLGIGRETHHVSYLSPLKYSGREYEFWNECIRNRHHEKCDLYSIINNRVHYARLMPTNEAILMSTIYDVFEFHKFYDLKVSPKFHLLCGGYSGFEVGVDMNLSNSNNPMYIRGELNLLGLSLRPTFCLRSRSTHPRSHKRLIKVSNQFDFRLAGIVFSPTYTQLYYDLTIPDYDKKEFFDFNSLSEKIRFSYQLMAEVPLRRITLRTGLFAERQKSMINMIDNRTTNVQFLLGFSYDYYHIQGWKNRDSKYLTNFE